MNPSLRMEFENKSSVNKWRNHLKIIQTLTDAGVYKEI